MLWEETYALYKDKKIDVQRATIKRLKIKKRDTRIKGLWLEAKVHVVRVEINIIKTPTVERLHKIKWHKLETQLYMWYDVLLNAERLVSLNNTGNLSVVEDKTRCKCTINDVCRVSFIIALLN